MNIDAVFADIEQQRNHAMTECAKRAGVIADLQARLAAAQVEIEGLKAKLAPADEAAE